MAVTAIFPSLAGVAFPVNRTPEWSTEVHRSISGKRTTYGRFVYPIYHYELPYDSGSGGFLRSSTAYREYQELFAFFNSVGGQRDLFKFLDLYDSSATLQPIGVGDSTTRAFQLTRTTTGTVSSFTDPVFSSTITALLVGGSSVSSTTYTVSDTSLVTFSTGSIPATGSTIAWSGTYWWLCRMDDDSATFERFMYNLVELKKITFSSEKI